MKNEHRKCAIVLLLVSIAATVIVFCFLPPIPQNLDYHHFAHDVPLISIPNFYNVVSNTGFIISGIWGFFLLKKHTINSPIISLLFIGMVLTGVGSAYYHYNPRNETLVWDRLPMTLVFSSFFADVYAQYFNQKQAKQIWIFTLCAGIGSIVYWYYTESIGMGDLRLYAIVQFLPMLLISIMVVVFWGRNKKLHGPLLATFLFYAAAKIFEHYDHLIFTHSDLIGGHSVKHLFASFATTCIVWMVKRNHANPAIKTL